MSDSQYSPLTSALIRTLTDKSYEKRKFAALDIEKLIRELHEANHIVQLKKVLSILKGLINTPTGNTRKGGLIGLAAAAIGLGKNSAEYTMDLIPPVLPCFTDRDSRVRYYACESLYNIVKICRSATINHFDELFDALWRLSSDVDSSVRSGSELLDRLLKDIVIATINVDIFPQLMVLVRDRIYVQKTIPFILSWLSVMLTSPSVSILPYLSEVLDGLFQTLTYDDQPEIRDAGVTVIEQFKERIQDTREYDDNQLERMIKVLIMNTSREGNQTRRSIALIWLEDFVIFHNVRLLSFLPTYLTAVLPFLEDPQLRAKEVNARLMELFSDDATIDIVEVIKVLLNHVKNESRETRLAVLNWISHMHHKAPANVFAYMDRIFPILLSMLSDSCDDVLLLDLQLLSDICEEKMSKEVELNLTLNEEVKMQLLDISPYLIKFAVSLLKMFKDDPSLRNERGVLIIRQLCLLLDSAHIYRCLAVLLLEEEDSEFVSRMVAMLNGILLTATELFEMRDQLKELSNENCVSLFECLYRCWAYQPIALLGLCILSHNYVHASELAICLSRLDVTVDILLEIDKLVQLIESPILSYVRLDLLDEEHQRPLASVLSALLMLLPQTEAFNILHKRLQSIPSLILFKGEQRKKSRLKINFEPLFAHFQRITEHQRQSVRKKHQLLLKATVK